MSRDASPFALYRSGIFFLLVGGNPLPNYVAASLLTAERAVVYLLRTHQTVGVADRLAAALARDRPDLDLLFLDVPDDDGPGVARAVDACARRLERERPNAVVGLNFSGGTKPMSVYSVLALRSIFPRTILSYLHARGLKMIIDSGGHVVGLKVERNVVLTLEKLGALHGYGVRGGQVAPRNLAISEAIKKVHTAPGGLDAFRKWLETWKGGPRLPDSTDSPILQPLIDTFAAASQGAATTAAVAKALGFEGRGLGSCGKYFAGDWFEEITLHAVQEAARHFPLDDCRAGFRLCPEDRTDFEIDVAATTGYQLFAISCIVSQDRPRAKEHLLEIFTRAGQMGGDEARFAVVCFYPKPEELEKEVSQDWDAAGKLKVFGPQHLEDLSTHILEWFRTANQEVT